MLYIAPIGGGKWAQKEQRLFVGQLPLILMESVVVKKKKKLHSCVVYQSYLKES